MIGGPALKPRMQRSHNGRSSGLSAARRPTSTFAAWRFWPSGVIAGNRPFAGLPIKDVRLLVSTDDPNSNQNWLYVPGSPDRGARSTRLSAERFSNAAASSSVRRSLSANSFDRCSGVSDRKSHTPCKSGCPSGVRGATYGLAAPGRAADDVRAACALKVGMIPTSAIATAARIPVLTDRRGITPPGHLSHHLTEATGVAGDDMVEKARWPMAVSHSGAIRYRTARRLPWLTLSVFANCSGGVRRSQLPRYR